MLEPQELTASTIRYVRAAIGADSQYYSTGVMEVGGGGPGGHRPPQFFRLGGHRGAQSILITSSESVSSYSIVTWC